MGSIEGVDAVTMRFKLPPGGDVPPIVAARQLPPFSETMLGGLSAVAMTSLAVKTRMAARAAGRPFRFKPEAAERLAQIERHLAGRARKADKLVYVIGTAAIVKIGVARDPKRRLATLQTACAERLGILAVFPGGQDRERELHIRFARYRLQGEWFRREGHLRRFVERCMEMAP